MTSFHFPQSWTQAIQFFIFIWQISCVMLSSHPYLGLPCDLLVRGFQLNIFLTVLVSGILSMWPNQLSLWALIWLIIFLCCCGCNNLRGKVSGNLHHRYGFPPPLPRGMWENFVYVVPASGLSKNWEIWIQQSDHSFAGDFSLCWGKQNKHAW